MGKLKRTYRGTFYKFSDDPTFYTGQDVMSRYGYTKRQQLASAIRTNLNGIRNVGFGTEYVIKGDLSDLLNEKPRE
jgi:hypothetical protein